MSYYLGSASVFEIGILIDYSGKFAGSVEFNMIPVDDKDNYVYWNLDTHDHKYKPLYTQVISSSGKTKRQNEIYTWSDCWRFFNTDWEGANLWGQLSLTLQASFMFPLLYLLSLTGVWCTLDEGNPDYFCCSRKIAKDIEELFRESQANRLSKAIAIEYLA